MLQRRRGPQDLRALRRRNLHHTLVRGGRRVATWRFYVALAVARQPGAGVIALRRKQSYIHLLRAKDLIDREYSRKFDVPVLAREAHASTAHSSRSFKRAFGETPHRFLQRRRIERAKELLRGTDLSVTEVSVEVGFQSLASLSTAFRGLVGEPPSSYSDRWRVAAPPLMPACFTLMFTRPVASSSFREAGARG